MRPNQSIKSIKDIKSALNLYLCTTLPKKSAKKGAF